MKNIKEISEFFNPSPSSQKNSGILKILEFIKL